MADSMNEILNPGLDKGGEPGFPHAPAGWKEETALETARSESLELGDDHWVALRSLQEYFFKHEKPSDINARELHDALDEKFHSSGGIKYLYTLFPGGPVAQGCRIAGLNPPAGSTNASFGSVQ